MIRLLILGYGNPLRGDDGLGWHAVERLRRILAGDDIELRAVHQLTPEIAELLSRVERVVFVDAAAEGEPGVVQRRRLAPSETAAAFTHQATPSALLAASQALYGRAPEAELFSIPVESTELGYQLAPKVDQALKDLVSAIVALAR